LIPVSTLKEAIFKGLGRIRHRPEGEETESQSHGNIQSSSDPKPF
jgi:hypothetical protein